MQGIPCLFTIRYTVQVLYPRYDATSLTVSSPFPGVFPIP